MLRSLGSILVLFALCCSYVQANMRGPRVFINKGMEDIRSNDFDLTVLKEELNFDADEPYTPSNLSTTGQHVRVSAKYTIYAEQNSVYTFNFVSAKPAKAKAFINNQSIDIKRIVPENYAERRINSGKFQTMFKGEIKEGVNTIQVSYSQKMSYFETGHGYFSDGDFKTSFEYHLYPLKEWTLDPDFVLTVKVSFKDDTGLSKYFFGSDYTVEIMGFDNVNTNDNDRPKNPRKADNIQVSLEQNSPSDRLTVSAQFDSNFPDVLEIICR